MKTIIYIDPFITDNNKLTEEIVNDLNIIVENQSNNYTELYLHSEKLKMDDKKLNIFLQKNKITAFNFKMFKIPNVYNDLDKNIENLTRSHEVQYIKNKNSFLYQALLSKPFFKSVSTPNRRKKTLTLGSVVFLQFKSYKPYAFTWYDNEHTLNSYNEYLQVLNNNYDISTHPNSFSGVLTRREIKNNFSVRYGIPIQQLSFLPE